MKHFKFFCGVEFLIMQIGNFLDSLRFCVINRPKHFSQLESLGSLFLIMEHPGLDEVAQANK